MQLLNCQKTNDDNHCLSVCGFSLNPPF